jgi:phosphohistidine phosphatase
MGADAMKLYLVRHGIAVDIGEEGVRRDADRTLSAEGRRKTRAAARGLCRIVGPAVARVVSSPLPRALETARIFAQELKMAADVETLGMLAPGGDARTVAAWLGRQPPADLMLVGHMPDLSELASCLACGRGFVRVAFRKAAVLCLDFEQGVERGGGCIEWLLQPGLLRRLAEA